ncbi:DinB family protein [Neisseriaceae bacterium TC5R-5]|nr:DinB family protein [Neisseriaceae bacterium TC5R-5]
MIDRTYLLKLAEYNQWMNDKIYQAAAKLTPAQLAAPRQDFFGSIVATLNHLLVADLIWLTRFQQHPAHFPALAILDQLPTPQALDQILYPDLAKLTVLRQQLDQCITQLVGEIQSADLQQTLSYRTMRGISASKPFTSVLAHFFNHQTHHRGQLSTLLFQAGLDIGVTDLLVLLDDVAADV